MSNRIRATRRAVAAGVVLAAAAAGIGLAGTASRKDAGIRFGMSVAQNTNSQK